MTKERITIKGAKGKTLTTWTKGLTVIVSIRNEHGDLEGAIEVNKGDLIWQAKGE